MHFNLIFKSLLNFIFQCHCNFCNNYPLGKLSYFSIAVMASSRQLMRQRLYRGLQFQRVKAPDHHGGGNGSRQTLDGSSS